MWIAKHLECCLLVCAFLTASGAHAGITLLSKDLVSREITLAVGGGSSGTQSIVSREYSMSVHNGKIFETQQLNSREISTIVTDVEPPAIITELEVQVSPTGETAELDWSNYNELLQHDVVDYRIFVSTAPFTDITGMTPYTNLSAGVNFLEITGLTPWQDHYFAVVAVDELGGYNSTVSFSAAYVLSPEIISREISISMGSALVSSEYEAVSREISLVVSSPEPPVALTDFTVEVSPTGDAATLDWSNYNELLQRDIIRYDIYYSSAPFTSVAGMTPYVTSAAETSSIEFTGLTPWVDHYFAIVPVDAFGGYETNVAFGAAYVLAPEVVSREISLFLGNSAGVNRDTISRELSVVVSDGETPAPVTGENSGFTAIMSTQAYQAIDLDWSSYDEISQRDIVRYRIYVGTAYFDDVSSMTPFTYAPANNGYFTLTGLDALGIYYVAAVAEDADGNFNPVVRSVSAQASTAGVGDAENLQVVCGETMLTFSWEAPTDAGFFLDHYNLYFAGATEPESLVASATDYVATNLARAHGYPFRIATVDRFGFESSGVSLLAATLLENPTNLVAVGQDQKVALSWDAVAPADLIQYYAVYQSDAVFSNLVGKTPINTTSGTTLLVSGLNNYSNYYFAVATVNVADAFHTNVISILAMPEPDLVGPSVVGFTPDEPFRVDDSHVEQLFSGFTLRFNEPIDPASISINDISVSNATEAIEVLSVQPISDTQYHVSLAWAYRAGNNVVSVGTNLFDLAGNRADPFTTTVVLSNPALPPGSGDGLLGTYYNGTAFEGTSSPRIDPSIQFDWYANAPMPGIGVDHFSTRWTGEIEPRFDGSYTFTLNADDGVRMWLDGVLILDDWSAGSGEVTSTNIVLHNDRRYTVQLEYFENTGDANIRLGWKFSTLPQETIPQSQLYSGLSFTSFAATPTMSPVPGAYVGITEVTLNSTTTNATIYYTVTDSAPHADWIRYDGNPVVLVSNVVLRAIATKAGLNDSGVRVGEYAVSVIHYSIWTADHFSGETDPLVIGKTADPDADSIPNLEEYAYCLDPNSSTNTRRTALEMGDQLEHWMIEFSMPTNQTIGGFCWSPNLETWIDAVIEKTNEVWVSRSNRCEIAEQTIFPSQPDLLKVDSLLQTKDPIFFRFDKTSVPLAVHGLDDMQLSTQMRVQEWFLDLYLRAEDPTLQLFLEIQVDGGEWQRVNFSYATKTWYTDDPNWIILEQTEEAFSEWKLQLKLPRIPVNAPVTVRYGVEEK